MDEQGGDGSIRRGGWARVGILALNLIAPGLDVLRVGDWRRGLLCLIAPYGAVGLIVVGIGLVPIGSYSAAVGAMVVIIGVMLAVYALPGVLTWRQSAVRLPLRWWSRWPALTAVTIAMAVIGQCAVELAHRFYKPFFIPSESMMPTLAQGDKLIADMRGRGPYKRGDVILFDWSGQARIDRIAGLPGDRIEIRNGVPIVNGTAALHSRRGIVAFASQGQQERATIVIERLPGAATSHAILDIGYSALTDDIPEAVVPVGHVFVLGDNRDQSADSRFPADEMGGVGMVPLKAIVGRPMYIHWSSDRARIGRRLDR